ncbi:DUF4192 family protein [Brevibacterium sediminis]|uniref:DUF4192 family protein n=1 Tax=Brevibacterium sediminis TaxID=1857024 RepID=UPI0015D5DFE0|nr:DUF4192 family protein [Brevibacterium sediminis]
MKTPARTPEDIIGIIPHTLGYTPRRSLVAVIVGTELNGSQTSSTTMRIDFDRESAAQTLSQGGGWYADLVMRAGTVTGVFLVLYDDDYQPVSAFGAGADAEYAEVHRGLIRAAIDELAITFASRSVDTLSAWWVNQEHFGRIDEDGYDCTPLIEATTSACATELVAGGSNPVNDPEDLVIAPMPADAFADSRRGHAEEWMGTDEAFAILAEVYPRLDAMRCEEDAIDEARIHDLMDLPTVMALDTLLVEKWSRDALEMILSFDHPDFPPSLVKGLDGDELIVMSRRVVSQARAAQQLVGLSARAPRPRDIMLTIAFLKDYLQAGHPRARANTYAVIAWFEWSLGGSTMALNYARAALGLEAEHGLAELIVSAVDMGCLPRWLTETQRTTI